MEAAKVGTGFFFDGMLGFAKADGEACGEKVGGHTKALDQNPAARMRSLAFRES